MQPRTRARRRVVPQVREPDPEVLPRVGHGTQVAVLEGGCGHFVGCGVGLAPLRQLGDPHAAHPLPHMLQVAILVVDEHPVVQADRRGRRLDHRHPLWGLAGPPGRDDEVVAGLVPGPLRADVTDVGEHRVHDRDGVVAPVGVLGHRHHDRPQQVQLDVARAVQRVVGGQHRLGGRGGQVGQHHPRPQRRHPLQTDRPGGVTLGQRGSRSGCRAPALDEVRPLPHEAEPGHQPQVRPRRQRPHPGDLRPLHRRLISLRIELGEPAHIHSCLRERSRVKHGVGTRAMPTSPHVTRPTSCGSPDVSRSLPDQPAEERRSGSGRTPAGAEPGGGPHGPCPSAPFHAPRSAPEPAARTRVTSPRSGPIRRAAHPRRRGR